MKNDVMTVIPHKKVSNPLHHTTAVLVLVPQLVLVVTLIAIAVPEEMKLMVKCKKKNYMRFS